MAVEAVLQITDENFEQEVMNSDIPVLVDFWAEWCMPCRMLGPVIDEIATEFAGKAKVGKVDTDANREVSLKFEISAIPTVLLIKGGQIVQKFVGVNGKQDYVDALNNAID
jgi:thioredoxin 1